jgi:ParB family chromosome partitioning protein
MSDLPLLPDENVHGDIGHVPLMLHVVEEHVAPAPVAPAIAPRIAPSAPPHGDISVAAPAPSVAPVQHAAPQYPAPDRGEAIFQLEVDRIKPNPHQPRRMFDESALKDLASSIREFGILQPLVVTKVEREVPTGTAVEYELIAGERRLMASKLIGLERVPAIIRRVGAERERLELAIIENLQRENLNGIEMARAYARLQDQFRMTQREIASRLGKSREVIANTVRLLDLPAEVQAAIEQNRISDSHGRLLLSVDDQALQRKLFHDLLNRQMTTRELREQVGGMRTAKREGNVTPQQLSPELRALQDKLAAELGAPVKISTTGDSGKITISFYSKEELDHILDKLAAEHDVLL